jgi:hypothetical protein
MDSNSIKWAIIGMGGLLAVLVIGVLSFNFFNQRVSQVDNTVNVINVSSIDENTNYGILYVDMGKLVSTVTDADFATYYEANKIALATVEYTYKTTVLNDDGTTTDQDVVTNIDLTDFPYGLETKLSTDMKDKYTFTVTEAVITNQ